MIGSIRLSDIATQMDAQLIGEDVSFTAVSTDSRTLKTGELFIALTGASFDGHRFVPQAVDRGAVAVVVSARQSVDLPQLLVDNTEKALGFIGSLNRQKSGATVIALTGSQGKTSVKEFTGAILKAEFNVLVTQGNLNNTIGAPLTLLRLDKGHDRAVIELGANAAGEIAWTARITDPHIVLINNAAETHLEGFGSLQGVVRAKGEIIDSGKSTHTVILNADDDNCEAWYDRAMAAGRQVRLFSIAKPQKPRVDYQALNIQADADGSRYTLTTPRGWVDCFIPMPGRHIVANAVAAAALAVEAGASLEKVAETLACVKPVPGRLYPLMGVQGARLLDDSYNASPSSFKAAIDVLADVCHASQRRAVVIMGDMAELGDKAEMLHAEIGSYAREHGVNQVWTVGAFSGLATQAFGDGAHHFDSQESLCVYAREAMANDMVVLVKGSRSAGMDAVVAQLTTGGPH